jgi:hypothetical protein
MRKYNLFQETEYYEDGFREHYAEKVYPIQEGLEVDRRKFLKKFLFRLILTSPVFLFYFWFTCSRIIQIPNLEAQVVFDETWVLAICFIIFIYPLFFYVFSTPYYYIKAVKNRVFKNVITFYKGFHYFVSGEVCPLDVKDSKLLPKFLSYSSEDKIVGVYKDVSISMAEVKLMKPRLLKPIIVLFLLIVRGFIALLNFSYQHRIMNFMTGYYTRTRIVIGEMENKAMSYSNNKFQEWFEAFKERALEKVMFKGLFITFDLPGNFYGTTIGLKDGGTVGNMIKGASLKRLKKVSLESMEFEKIFEVYSTSQIESRCILDPLFMERLMDLSKVINNKGKKGMNFSFYQDKGFIMIPQRRNLFEPRSMFRSCVNTKDSKKFLKEMSILLDIIDILRLNMDKNRKRVNGK